MRNPFTHFTKRASASIKKADESKSVFSILLAFFGWVSAAFGIFFLMSPLMTTPLIPQLAFWRGLLKISDHTRIEVFVGFWGVCTYYYQTTSSHQSIEIKSMCTPARPVYSFHMSDHVSEAKGDLNRTQTLFFFWYPLAAILTGVAILLSLSQNFRMWRYASLLCLTAGLITFSTFTATLVIFAELKSELMKTQASSLVPVKGEILSQTYLPFISSIALFLSSGFFFQRYLQGRSLNYHNSEVSDQKSNLGHHNRNFWSRFKRTKLSKETEEKQIIESKHEELPKNDSHSQLPPPPPLQDKPTRKQ